MGNGKVDVAGISFSEKCSGHIGNLLINGLVIERPNGFDPLVKIWTSVRKRIFERAKLDVVGIFVHDVKQELIIGSFYLVYGDEVKDTDAHTKKFEESFPRQMALFEQTLLSFLETEYEEYLKVVDANIEASVGDFINGFLKSVGIRTKEDEIRAKRKDAKIASAVNQHRNNGRNNSNKKGKK